MGESDNEIFDLLAIKLVELKLKFNNFDTKSLSEQLPCFMINLDKLLSSKSVHCTILYGTSNVSQGFNNKTRVFLSDHLIYYSLLVPTKALKKDVNLCLCSAIPR